MPRKCAALGCGAVMRRGSGKSFHRFPIHAEKRKEWVRRTRRVNFSPNNDTVLCSDHFDVSCFDRTGQTVRLKEDSLPTVFNFPDRFPPKVPAAATPLPAPPPPKKRPDNSLKVVCSSSSSDAVTVTSDHCYALAGPESAKKKIEELLRMNEELKKTVRTNRQRERRLARKCKATADILDDLKSRYLLPTDKAEEVLQSVLSTVSLTLLHTKLVQSQGEP